MTGNRRITKNRDAEVLRSSVHIWTVYSVAGSVLLYESNAGMVCDDATGMTVIELSPGEVYWLRNRTDLPIDNEDIADMTEFLKEWKLRKVGKVLLPCSYIRHGVIELFFRLPVSRKVDWE